MNQYGIVISVGISFGKIFERNLDMENNGGINQGYFWKNNDGVLVKTYYSTKEGECNFDDF